MGFLDHLKAASGVGQPEIGFQLERASVGPGGLVRGQATLQGGQRSVTMNALDVRLYRVTQDKVPEKLAFDVVPLGGSPLAPGQRLQLAFELQVPPGSPPSSSSQRYELRVALDCPGLDPTAKSELSVIPQQDPFFEEECGRFFVLPEKRAFRYSSVRGDFRVVRSADGFATAWKTHVGARALDGSRRWRLDDWGRAVSPSPDGGHLAVSDQHKRVAIVDAATGRLVLGPIEVGAWVDGFGFHPSGCWIALSAEAAIVLDSTGRVVQRITDLGRAAGTDDVFFSGLTVGRDGVVYVLDSRSKRVVALDLSRGVLGSVAVRSHGDLRLSPSGNLLYLDADNAVTLFDPRLAQRGSVSVPGKQGVRYLGQQRETGGWTHFKTNAHLSVDERSVLVNDGSGQLWLADVASGKPTRRFERSLVDFVEDMEWLDPNHFVVLTNDGRVHGLRVDGLKLFEDMDA